MGMERVGLRVRQGWSVWDALGCCGAQLGKGTGDGIGPEVIQEVKKIIQWLNSNKSLDFEIDQDLAGGCSYDKHGTPITDEVFYKSFRK